MNTSLTPFQKKLCSALQQGLPICARPFGELARTLGSTEPDVLQETRALKEAGIIRRLSAVVNHRALGMASTLVTAHVPPEKLEEVTRAVNGLPGVSHNYLRDHHYNLWFTLQEKSLRQVRVTLCDLADRLGTDFHSLPVTRVFKLDVRFDVECEDDVGMRDVDDVPGTEPVELRAEHKHLLSRVQEPLEVTSRPFDSLRFGSWRGDDVLRLLTELRDLGVIRRIAAVMDHRKLGFTANVMFAAELSGDAIVEAGRRLARFRTVSHCYERETFAGWRYNLFAMMHGRQAGQIQRTIETFTEAGDVRSYELLPTVAELKKQPVRHNLL